MLVPLNWCISTVYWPLLSGNSCINFPLSIRDLFSSLLSLPFPCPFLLFLCTSFSPTHSYFLWYCHSLLFLSAHFLLLIHLLALLMFQMNWKHYLYMYTVYPFILSYFSPMHPSNLLYLRSSFLSALSSLLSFSLLLPSNFLSSLHLFIFLFTSPPYLLSFYSTPFPSNFMSSPHLLTLISRASMTMSASCVRIGANGP